MKETSRRQFIKDSGLVIAGNIALLLFPAKQIVAASRIPGPGKKDRCPVCGMFVYKYPKWAAGIIFKDGSRYFHCCPKCMLHNLNHVQKYQPGKKREDIVQVWVTEYYTTRRMDAGEVSFVIGTKLIGPMGLDLIPIKGAEAAATFLKDYKGEEILPLQDITPEIIERVRRGKLN